jgi:hypothetical protein
LHDVGHQSRRSKWRLVEYGHWGVATCHRVYGALGCVLRRRPDASFYLRASVACSLAAVKCSSPIIGMSSMHRWYHAVRMCRLQPCMTSGTWVVPPTRYYTSWIHGLPNIFHCYATVTIIITFSIKALALGCPMCATGTCSLQDCTLYSLSTRSLLSEPQYGLPWLSAGPVAPYHVTVPNSRHGTAVAVGAVSRRHA